MTSRERESFIQIVNKLINHSYYEFLSKTEQNNIINLTRPICKATKANGDECTYKCHSDYGEYCKIHKKFHNSNINRIESSGNLNNSSNQTVERTTASESSESSVISSTNSITTSENSQLSNNQNDNSETIQFVYKDNVRYQLVVITADVTNIEGVMPHCSYTPRTRKKDNKNKYPANKFTISINNGEWFLDIKTLNVCDSRRLRIVGTFTPN